jgi:hypothetical protein
MKKQIATISSLIILACGLAHAQDVAATFEQQDGGTSGTGLLHRVPMKWDASRPIEKTLATALRVKDFSRNDVTFVLEEPVNITQVVFSNLNRTSKGSIRFFNANGDAITPGNLDIANQEGNTMDSFAMVGGDDIVNFASSSQEPSATINFKPVLRKVSKITVVIQEDNGLFDIGFRGFAGQ